MMSSFKNSFSFALTHTFFLSLQAEEIVELDPYVVESHSFGLWDMSLKYTFIEPSDSPEDRRISQ